MWPLRRIPVARLTCLAVWMLAAGTVSATPDPGRTAQKPSDALTRGLVAHHRRDFATARQALELAAAEVESPPVLRRRAATALARLADVQRATPGAVGVLAPLSGPYASIGRAVTAGVEIALEGRPGVTLYTADTKGTQEDAGAAVDVLVHEHKVVALVGPVGDRESRAAALRASELGVPIVLLAAADDLAALGPWVFRHRVTAEAQTRAVATHALRDLSMRRFAILYPDDAFGRGLAQSFWETVEAAGAEVRAAQAYPPQGDVRPAALALVGGRYAGARSTPFEIRGRRKEKAYHPMVEFEALFVPDSPRRARQVLAALAYYDVALRGAALDGLQRRRAHAPVLVLGPGSWSRAGVVHGAEPAMQRARLPAVFDAGSSRPAARRFLAAFRAKHGATPGELEAQAHDAAGWLWLALQQAGAQSRARVQGALQATRGFAGVSSQTLVGPAGDTRTALPILEIRGHRTVEVLPSGQDAGAPTRPAARSSRGAPIRLR